MTAYVLSVPSVLSQNTHAFIATHIYPTENGMCSDSRARGKFTGNTGNISGNRLKNPDFMRVFRVPTFRDFRGNRMGTGGNTWNATNI